MAFLANSKVLPHKRVPLSRKYSYEIPERYRNCFYLANAAFFDSTNWFLHRAYEKSFSYLKKTFNELRILDAIESINQCNSIIDVRFPIKRKNGSYETVRGFFSQHGQKIGHNSGLGGLRIDENITRDQIKALSVLSSFKNHCVGLNLYGCHSGIKIQPKNYTEEELKEIIELFTIEICKRGYCVNNTDILHPDYNTNEKIISWVSEAYGKYSGQNLNVASVGKSVEFGGIENFEKCAALGAFKSLNFILNNDNLMEKVNLTKEIQGKTFIIQGLGKVGAPLATLLVENGAICVGVREFDGYLYDSKGIDLPKLLNHLKEYGTIQTFLLAKSDQNDKIFTENCDILLLAGPHKSLICYAAKDVKAKIILEASDGPVTPTSQRIFEGSNKLVVPDIYSGTGTNIAGYFEYIKTLQQMGLFCDDILKNSHNIYVDIVRNFACDKKVLVGGQNVTSVNYLDHNFVSNALDCVILETGHEILKNLYDHKLGLDLRSAAYIVAIKNIFKTLSSSGKFK